MCISFSIHIYLLFLYVIPTTVIFSDSLVYFMYAFISDRCVWPLHILLTLPAWCLFAVCYSCRESHTVSSGREQGGKADHVTAGYQRRLVDRQGYVCNCLSGLLCLGHLGPSWFELPSPWPGDEVVIFHPPFLDLQCHCCLSQWRQSTLTDYPCSTGRLCLFLI